MIETIGLVVLIGIGIYVVRAARGLLRERPLTDDAVLGLGRVLQSGELDDDQAAKVRASLGRLIMR